MSQLTHGMALRNEKAIEEIRKELEDMRQELARRRGGRPKKESECSQTQN